MAKKKVKLAIFDIDGTIFRSSLLIEYIHGLVDAGLFPQKALKEVERDYINWLDRKQPYEKYIMSVVAVHLKYIKDCKVSEVRKVVHQTVKSLKDRTYRYTRHLIKELRAKGYHMVLISGSPQHVVSVFSKELGFDEAFGIIYETKKGRYTGKEVKKNSALNKHIVVEEWIAETGINIDFKNSFAIGDSEGDSSILSLVGNPVAFNPNMALAKIAKRKKWPIVVERKDVVYDVRDFKFRQVP